MQHLIFESSPFFVLACFLLGVGYAYLLYRAKHTWSRRVNQGLFALRAVVVALLAFLLIGPILKLTNNIFEKPSLVFLIDNSTSVRENTDSLQIRKELDESTKQLRSQGYNVVWRNLAGNEVEKIKFDNEFSDLNGALRNVVSDYENKNLAGIILITDGIYNSGASLIVYAVAHTNYLHRVGRYHRTC